IPNRFTGGLIGWWISVNASIFVTAHASTSIYSGISLVFNNEIRECANMILVTGGSGFIGSHLVDQLCSRGESVRCLLRRKDYAGLPPQAEPVFGDLVSGEGLEDALKGVDTVIHLAGVTKALAAGDYYAGNAHATENLGHAVAGRGIRLVHVSSLAAVGPNADGT